MPKIKYRMKKEKTVRDILDQPLDRRKAKGFLQFVLIPLILVLIDQVTKFAVASNMSESQVITVIPGLFNINYVLNKGAALGIFKDQTIFLVTLSSLLTIFIYYLAWQDFRQKHTIIPEMIIVGGAIGNLLDRLFLGGAVRDFLEVPFFAVMNFADWFVSAGIALLILKYLIYSNRSEPSGRQGRQDG